MSKFHIGILVACFLGALITFVVLGVLHLYLEERPEKHPEAEKPTDRMEQMPVFGIPLAADYWSHDHLPAPAFQEHSAAEETIICYLFIVME